MQRVGTSAGSVQVVAVSNFTQRAADRVLFDDSAILDDLRLRRSRKKSQSKM